jgi:hypothetical protein
MLYIYIWAFCNKKEGNFKKINFIFTVYAKNVSNIIICSNFILIHFKISFLFTTKKPIL